MDKKAIALETLMRVIIMIILVIIVFKFGGKVARIFGGSDAPEHFEELTSQINNLASGEQNNFFIQLDPGMAIAAFNDDSTKILCKRCRNVPLKDAYSADDLIFEKPTDNACTKNCMCLCTKVSFRDEKTAYCEKRTCKETNMELSKELLNQETQQKLDWDNGFLFIRDKDNKFAVGGAVINSPRYQVCAKKEYKDQKLMLSVSNSPSC